MNLAKIIVFFLCILGAVWFPAWVLAVIVYEAWIRRGKDVLAVWIGTKNRGNWD